MINFSERFATALGATWGVNDAGIRGAAGASGNNFKLSTRRNLTANVLVADAGAAMAATAASAAVD